MGLIQKIFGAKKPKAEKAADFLQANLGAGLDPAKTAETAKLMVSHAKGKKWKNLLIGLGVGLICVILDALLARICLPCGGIFIKNIPSLIEAVLGIV